MSGPEIIVPTAVGAGAVIGWLARHFKNGKGADSEVVVLLRQIAANTQGLPSIVQRLEGYMDKGLIAMSQIDRMEREGR